MAIQFRGGTSGNSGTSTGTSQAITLPAGATAGDILFVIMRLVTNAGSFTQSAGTGTWTIDFAAQSTNGGYWYGVAHRVLQAGDTAPTFSWTNPGSNCWSCGGFFSNSGGTLALDKWAPGDPAQTGVSSTTSITPNPVTGAGGTEASIILTDARAAAANATSSHTYTPPTGWTWNDGDGAFFSNASNNARFSANAYQLGVSGTVTPGSQSLTDSASDTFWFAAFHALVSETVSAVPGGPPPLIPPGLQSPMVLATPARYSTPAPPQLQPAPAPQLIPPGLQSPMSLAEPARPATQPPPAPPQPPTGTPSPPPIPPGLQSPMSLAEPARYSIPPPPVQQPAPAPAPTPPGLQSPMSLAEPARPATSAPPAVVPPGVSVPAPLLTPPGLQSPMSLAVPSRPATSAPPALPPAIVPGTPQLHPPGRMSPMSLGLPMVQPPQAPSTPGPPPPIPPIPSGVILGGQSAGGDRDPEVRMFRSVMPGEIPVAGSQLPKLHGRGYAAPPPSRAEDVEVLWEAPPEPAEPPGPGAAAIALRGAQGAVSGLYDLGKIIAPEPYVPPAKARCGAIRKLGVETLRCSKKRGHPGMHSDRGVRWG